MFVLGIDPGLSRCGYAAVDASGPRARAVALGAITTPATAPLPARLAALQAEVRRLLRELQPGAVAVERVFFQANVRTAMSVGQASGVVLAEASAAGCTVTEYTPTQVKTAVTGDGRAEKRQVQRMVQLLLGLAEPPRPADAADAAALALCHLAAAPLARRTATAIGRAR